MHTFIISANSAARNFKYSSNLQIEELIDARTVKKPLLRVQRSTRHKNCRIGGLMFDNQHT